MGERVGAHGPLVAALAAHGLHAARHPLGTHESVDVPVLRVPEAAGMGVVESTGSGSSRRRRPPSGSDPTRRTSRTRAAARSPHCRRSCRARARSQAPPHRRRASCAAASRAASPCRGGGSPPAARSSPPKPGPFCRSAACSLAVPSGKDSARGLSLARPTAARPRPRATAPRSDRGRGGSPREYA